MFRKSILAIDPGASGGLALIGCNGKIRIEKLVATSLYELLKAWRPHVIVMEEVGYHVMGNNAQASCTFARHCGYLQGLIDAYCQNEVGNIEVIMVSPKEWIKWMPADIIMPVKGKDEQGNKYSPAEIAAAKKARKQAIRDYISNLYPSFDLTLRTADAVGMLEWYLRKSTNNNEEGGAR